MSDFREHAGRTHPGECYRGCEEWFDSAPGDDVPPRSIVPVSGYVQVPTRADAIPGDCTCRWATDRDCGGWYLVAATMDCPAHYAPPGADVSIKER